MHRGLLLLENTSGQQRYQEAIQKSNLTHPTGVAIGHVSQRSFIGSMFPVDVTNLDAAVVPVESANLSPIADPSPFGAVMERGADRRDANSVFSCEELDSDGPLRNILPHGDGLWFSWSEASNFPGCQPGSRMKFFKWTSFGLTYLVRA